MTRAAVAGLLLASLWRCSAQVPAGGGSNLAKPRMGGVAIASEFGQWQATGHGPISPPGGTVSVTPVTFTLPDSTAWVPFTAGAAVAITGDASPETVTVTGVACATGTSTCAFSANFAFSHPGSFTVSSATGGLQEAINYEQQLGGGVVAADPAFTGNVASLAASLKLPSDVLLVDETGGNFNFYGMGNGGAPSLIARFSSATGTNLGGGGGSGTVTSVGLALPAIFSVSGSPVTLSGTMTGTLASELANSVFAGPTSGSAAVPAFRPLAGADLPAPGPGTLGGIESAAAVSHEWINSISTGGVAALSQPAFVDLLGMAAPTQLPAATASTQGAIELTGDLGGSATAPTVVGVHFGSTGIALGAAPTLGQCLEYNGTNITGTACGSGGSGNATSIQGVAVSSTAPTTNQVLQYNGTQWVPASGASAGVSTLQVDSNTALSGAVQLISGTGLSSTQAGQAATLNVNTASSSLAGIVALTGDLGGTSAAPLVNAVHVSVSNSSSTGTTVNTLAKVSATGAVIMATTDTTGAVGIVTAGAGTTGSATIGTAGIVSCQFDATAITVGDWVQISSTTAGDCHDAGATKPASGEIVGHAVTGGAASTVQSVLMEISW